MSCAPASRAIPAVDLKKLKVVFPANGQTDTDIEDRAHCYSGGQWLEGATAEGEVKTC